MKPRRNDIVCKIHYLKQTLPNLSQGSQFNSLQGKQSDSAIDNVA